MKYYYYGMKMRGFSIGCQPMNGLVKRLNSDNDDYWDILVYNRKLTDRELRMFELECIKEEDE